MSTAIQPHDHRPDHEASAQSLMLWMGIAMLVVTLAIVAGITLMSTTAGMVVAYGAVIAATIVVLVYIGRFIGPEDGDH